MSTIMNIHRSIKLIGREDSQMRKIKESNVNTTKKKKAPNHKGEQSKRKDKGHIRQSENNEQMTEVLTYQ